MAGQETAAILDTGVGAGGGLELKLQVEVAEDGAGQPGAADVVDVVLAAVLRVVVEDGAVLDLPDVGLAIPTGEGLAIEQGDETGVIVE